MKYKSAKKPKVCHECGSEKIARILYGLPVYTEDISKKVENNEIVLGGCCITKDDPSWQCTDCGTVILE